MTSDKNINEEAKNFLIYASSNVYCRADSKRKLTISGEMEEIYVNVQHGKSVNRSSSTIQTGKNFQFDGDCQRTEIPQTSSI